MNKDINLFWRQTRSPTFKEKEKENNVTHAFLILLKKSNQFLDYLLSKNGIPKLKNKDKEVYFLITNKNKTKTLECKNKYILFINSKYNEAIIENEKEQERDIPDGLITDGETAILIESKVSASKDNSQIKRYNQTFFHGCAIEKQTTWEEIYSLIDIASKRSKEESVERYLLNHFKQYIEVIHMSGFAGIQFFNKDEEYNLEDAKYMLKLLIKDLGEKDWFKKLGYIIKERPKTSAWDYWADKEIDQDKDSPRNFPHYSIYIFEDFFGIDCLFHKAELKKIVENKNLYEQFTDLLEKLSNESVDYYFEAVNYRLLNNKALKDNQGNARVGASYTPFDFLFNLRQLRKHKDWKEILKNYLQLLLKEEIKQFSIIKKAHYKDKEYIHLSENEQVFKFIEKTLNETKLLYQLVYNAYKENKK